MGDMSDKASEFAENLSKSYGILSADIKDKMGKEFLNSRMLALTPRKRKICPSTSPNYPMI